jgi:hypothetical protein
LLSTAHLHRFRIMNIGNSHYISEVNFSNF